MKKSKGYVLGIISVILSSMPFISLYFAIIVGSISGVNFFDELIFQILYMCLPPIGFGVAFVGKVRTNIGTRARKLCNIGAGIGMAMSMVQIWVMLSVLLQEVFSVLEYPAVIISLIGTVLMFIYFLIAYIRGKLLWFEQNKLRKHGEGKNGKETVTERANGIHRETEKASGSIARLNKEAVPEAKKYPVCARCKKVILLDQTVWGGNHRFCQECTVAPGKGKKAVDQEQRRILTQSLVNVLVQVQNIKKEETVYGICCSVCRRHFADENLIFVDGNYYCENCYSFTYDKSGAEKTISTDELYQITYEISGVLNLSVHSRIVEFTDRLLAGGFRFQRVTVGGGANEMSHSDVMAYGVSYADYDDYKNCMERDLGNGEREKREKTEGGISFLDYSYICAFLSRNSLRVCMLSEREHIVLRWIDSSDKLFATTRVFAEKVIEEVFDNNCTLKRIDNQELDSTFLSNWN